ncbi:MAG: NAD-dependent epimerase/dehydratase family protein [Rhodospirillales bacterium]|nr:NAD-dependent epimerase/dehydratase family protein [Rhodospirillales bacterium]
MTRVLVTGATGFVGNALCPELLGAGYDVRAAVRRLDHPDIPEGVEPCLVPEIGPDTDWAEALTDTQAVIHLAARVHILEEWSKEPEAEFNRTNAQGTAHLAAAAATTGVGRLIYLSTIKVMGESSTTPFQETDTPAPEDPYGMSKLAGEQALAEIAGKTGLDYVVLRPPLVYGPGAKGTPLSLMKICQVAPPLPFASVDNHRSLIHVGNLSDAILCCLEAAKAAGQTYFVRDGDDVSTPSLIRHVAAGLGRPARLFSVPVGLLRLGGRILGKSLAASRVLGSLQSNDAKIRRELGWKPRTNVVQGLNEMAAWFTSGK